MIEKLRITNRQKTAAEGKTLGQEVKPDYEAVGDSTLSFPEMENSRQQTRQLMGLSGNFKNGNFVWGCCGLAVFQYNY